MAVSQVIAELRAAAPLVVPSLLASDFARLGEEIRKVEDAGAKLLHLDVMDGHFVPNISFGLPVVEAIRRSTTLPLDVHLMISDPGRFLRPFREAGADFLTIHIEAVNEPRRLLEEIREQGAGVGLSLNPPTPITTIADYLELCDLMLVMSVMPGFGGQQFQPGALEKLRSLRAMRRHDLLLAIDGGVSLDTAADCIQAGADLLITGTALFSQRDYSRFFEQMEQRWKIGKRVRV